MKTPFTSKKDAIDFRIIGSTYLVDIFTQMACY